MSSETDSQTAIGGTTEELLSAYVRENDQAAFAEIYRGEGEGRDDGHEPVGGGDESRLRSGTGGLPGMGGYVEVQVPVTGVKRFYRIMVRMP